jgi:hypothetical protein
MIQVKIFSGVGANDLTNLVNTFLKDIPDASVIDIKLSSSSDSDGKKVNAYTDVMVVYKR